MNECKVDTNTNSDMSLKDKVHKIMDHLQIDAINFSITEIECVQLRWDFISAAKSMFVDTPSSTIRKTYQYKFIYGKISDKIFSMKYNIVYEFTGLQDPKFWYNKTYVALKKLLKEKMDQENFAQYCEKSLGFKP